LTNIVVNTAHEFIEPVWPPRAAPHQHVYCNSNFSQLGDDRRMLYPTRLPWDQVAIDRRIRLLRRIHARTLAADPPIKKVSLEPTDE
jgi:hypothetical protein